MTENVKTLLIVGAVAVGGYLIYKKLSGGNRVSGLVHTGTGNSTYAATGNGTSGSADFWSTLGNVGKGLNGAVSSVESTYNGIYDLFGGQPTTSGTGQGNNGTNG